VSEALGERSVLAHTLHNVMASSLPVIVVTPPELAEEASRWVRGGTCWCTTRDRASGPGTPTPWPGVAAARRIGLAAAAGRQAAGATDVLQAVARALDDHAVAYAAHRGSGAFRWVSGPSCSRNCCAWRG
jgi:hypothetical protein